MLKVPKIDPFANSIAMSLLNRNHNPVMQDNPWTLLRLVTCRNNFFIYRSTSYHLAEGKRACTYGQDACARDRVGCKN